MQVNTYVIKVETQPSSHYTLKIHFNVTYFKYNFIAIIMLFEIKIGENWYTPTLFTFNLM